MRNNSFISFSISGAVALGILMAIGLMACDKGKSDSPAGLPSDPSYSLSTPAVDTPAPVKAVPVAPSAVTTPATDPSRPAAAPGATSMSGVWRTKEGAVYTFQQQGGDLLLTLQKDGAVTGTGRGVLNGSALQLTVVASNGNTQMPSNCSMQGSPDFQSFSGLCSGPSGQSPLNIFR